MNKKEKLIIETAIKLFAQKGFSQTSIQEIAAASGISKGAFYLHFKSKESLVLAILQYYYDNLKTNVFLYRNEDFSPKEIFLKQLSELLRHIVEHHEFMIMISKEQSIPLNNSTKKFILKMRLETHEFYHFAFRAIFGEEVSPYLWDLSVMIEGILVGYVRILFFDKKVKNLEQLARFIFRRIEALYKDLIKNSEEPMLSDEIMEPILQKKHHIFAKEKIDIKSIIEKIKKTLSEMDKEGDFEDLMVSLEVIQAEVEREIPRAAVIQGMLSNFKQFPLFEEDVKAISSYYKF